MQIKAYSIFDRKALTYNAAWFAVSDGVAVRMLKDLVVDNNTVIGRHPADYVLFHVGFWDDEKGAMVPISPLVHIADAVALVNVEA